MAQRTLNLKNSCVIKSHGLVSRGLQAEKGKKEGSPFREEMEVKLCLERARLMTEAYKQNEHEPMVTKRAKALRHVLENMTIYILQDELIVGNFAASPEKLPHYPDLQWRWLEKTICSPDGPYKGLLSQEEKEEMKTLHQYWKTRAIHGMERELLPDEQKKHFYYKGLSYWAYYYEVCTPSYEKVFSIGFNGILKEIDDKLNEIDDRYAHMDMNPGDYLDQKRDLEAMKMALEASIMWIGRYSQLALEMASKETDGKRRLELQKIADICSWIPANPPRTLYDAFQCFWFIHLISQFIEEPQVGCGARFDKIFYPLYEKDRDAGLITDDSVLELLECIWLKFLETGFLHPPIWSSQGGGGLGWQTVNIGGVDAAGEDMTNELTYLILNSVKTLNLLQPPLALRVHENTPRELLIKATQVLSTGVAQPALFNDQVIIPRLVSLGAPLEEARTYSVSGCMTPVIPGKNMLRRAADTGIVFAPKCLELALNQGKDMRSDDQIGVPTKDPAGFKSIEDIIEALLEQLSYAARGLYHIGNLANVLYEKYLQRPFLSALLDGCIERGQELRKWNYIPFNDCQIIGGINTADSLAAIKKLVFDEKDVSMEELIGALKNDWEGAEELRQMCLDAPKFGNDDDYVDLLCRDLYERITETVSQVMSYIGGKWVPAIIDGSTATAHYGFSPQTAATPDGRRAGETFADGTISPMSGRDKKAPTAALLSVSKIDPLKTWNHLFNQTFSPPFLKDQFTERFTDYLKTWSDLGVHHIQFSVVNRESLEEAQKKPEDYPELIVRVCGYAAYFIDLGEGLQDTVIERTSQSLP